MIQTTRRTDHRISVIVSGPDRAAVIAAFEARTAELLRSGYADTNGGGCYSNGRDTFTDAVEVAGPDERPLTNDELRKLRSLIPSR